jgi:hypothetical protein
MTSWAIKRTVKNTRDPAGVERLDRSGTSPLLRPPSSAHKKRKLFGLKVSGSILSLLLQCFRPQAPSHPRRGCPLGREVESSGGASWKRAVGPGAK